MSKIRHEAASVMRNTRESRERTCEPESPPENAPYDDLCLSCPALGAPDLNSRKVERWTVPHGNRGWDACSV
jgi:hypothetical protein